MAPKQPIDLVLHKGKKHLTKKEIEERRATEIKAPSDKVTPPDYLPKELRKEFKKISDQLMDIGIISNLDVDALARLLMSQKQYIDISVRMMSLDPLSDDYETLMRHQDKLFKQCRSASSDLGLTISSRCKLVVPKGKEKEEKSETEKRFGDRL